MLRTSIQHKILKTLPDDRPITAIQIIENLEKCPRGFYPISRTYDQDQDADLRESSIFKSTSARYLCLSKSEGLPNFVIQELLILGEKFNPPRGYSLLNRTADSEQKAWKKKQLCYRLVNLREARTAITDIIVCSRLKKAPQGFSLAGELNGVTICYKMGNADSSLSESGANGNDGGTPTATQPTRPHRPGLSPTAASPMYPSLNDGGDYEVLKQPGPPYPLGPSRPAPPRPPAPTSATTLSHQKSAEGGGNALDGVPFSINPKYMPSAGSNQFQLPVIKARTIQQILKDYDYSFAIERQVLN